MPTSLASIGSNGVGVDTTISQTGTVKSRLGGTHRKRPSAGGVPFDPDDPLALVMAPPAGETATERADREAREAGARAISEAIDEQLRAERDREKKRRKRVVKLLLLGQSESGEYSIAEWWLCVMF